MGTSLAILADCHTEVLFGIQKLLDPLCDVIFMVADEKSLVAALESTSPDLVVVDLSMQAERESNVARRISRSFSKIKFIVLSVHDEPVAAKECLEAGASAFVLKRRAVDDLVPAVEAVLRGEIYVSPGV